MTRGLLSLLHRVHLSSTMLHLCPVLIRCDLKDCLLDLRLISCCLPGPTTSAATTAALPRLPTASLPPARGAIPQSPCSAISSNGEFFMRQHRTFHVLSSQPGPVVHVQFTQQHPQPQPQQQLYQQQVMRDVVESNVLNNELFQQVARQGHPVHPGHPVPGQHQQHYPHQPLQVQINQSPVHKFLFQDFS